MAIPRPAAWGNTRIYYLAAASDGSMPALSAMTFMGHIYQENDITITTEDGETLELRETGNILRDQLQQEGTITIELSIIGIPTNVLNFWQTTTTGTGADAKRRVQSMVNNDKYAIAFYVPDVPESDTFEAPYCTVNMGIGYASTTGYIQPVSITVLKGAAEYLFQLGLVPATPPVPETPAG